MRSRTAEWFICKIRYEKVMEDGLQKKVMEPYVVDALSFTEAEERIIEEMSNYIIGEFDVVEIDRCPFKEIFFMDWAIKVLEKDAEDLDKAVRNKDKDAFKKWNNETLEDKFSKGGDSLWYKAKLQFITIDERTEKEKRSNVYYLVEGVSLESARQNIDKVMGGTMIDYVICSVSETKIMDVFEYTVKKEEES